MQLAFSLREQDQWYVNYSSIPPQGALVPLLDKTVVETHFERSHVQAIHSRHGSVVRVLSMPAGLIAFIALAQ